MQELFGKDGVVGSQEQLREHRAAGVALDADSSVPAGKVANLRGDVRWERKSRVFRERPHDLDVCGSCGAGVPDRERADLAGVDVLGRLDELGKARRCVARSGVPRRIDVHEDGQVALDDEGGCCARQRRQ